MLIYFVIVVVKYGIMRWKCVYWVWYRICNVDHINLNLNNCLSIVCWNYWIHSNKSKFIPKYLSYVKCVYHLLSITFKFVHFTIIQRDKREIPSPGSFAIRPRVCQRHILIGRGWKSHWFVAFKHAPWCICFIYFISFMYAYIKLSIIYLH